MRTGEEAAPLEVGRGICGRLDEALRREWLVANGIGGFACGTLPLALTRRYHGLLISALKPPVGRTVLVSKLEVAARLSAPEQSFWLGTNEYADGTIDPQGFRHLESFRLEGLVPVWTWALAECRLEQRLWMEAGKNLTWVALRHARGRRPLALTLVPLVQYRDYHGTTRGGAPLALDAMEDGFEVRAFPGAVPFRVCAPSARFVLDPSWHRNLRRRVEEERGLDPIEDLFAPGRFEVTLEPGGSLRVALSAEGPAEPRAAPLAHLAPRAGEPPWIARLEAAASQFLVARGAGASLLAGYPWFTDWGRDTMIALPGLLLETGRIEAAATVLRTFAGHLSEGMLPNRFPDAGEAPEYNTVDATLWFFEALRETLAAGGEPLAPLGRELYPALAGILEWHVRGTRFGIGLDAEDGLLRAGVPGVQLTWMDARVGDRPVTPRHGKPVEINALWHAAHVTLAELARGLGRGDEAARLAARAGRIARSFVARFWNEAAGWLNDVVDGPAGDDPSLRPNQVLALALPSCPLDAARSRRALSAVERELLTSFGLRTLAPGHAEYRGSCSAATGGCDPAYHQGTVWAWLLGPFALAHARAFGDAAAARGFLEPLRLHLEDAGLGQVSEIFDGDPPHTPRGCFAQAWSVGTPLRAWRQLSRASGGDGSRQAV